KTIVPPENYLIPQGEQTDQFSYEDDKVTHKCRAWAMCSSERQFKNQATPPNKPINPDSTT
ncbi:MAG TPA: hypothetical protein VMD05_07015, partial [Candidatus Nanoarchaeia archaeon]|nr:hypothetical protein [Candidatus Nanoarchaeia archaeon]